MTERLQFQRRRVGPQGLLLGFLLGLPQQAGGLLAGAEQLKIQRFIIRRGKHPLSSFLGDSLPRRTPKQT